MQNKLIIFLLSVRRIKDTVHRISLLLHVEHLKGGFVFITGI